MPFSILKFLNISELQNFIVSENSLLSKWVMLYILLKQLILICFLIQNFFIITGFQTFAKIDF